MPIFHKVVWFFRVFLKWSQWSCKTTPFLPCQKQLCSQWLVSVHISLHANELCSPAPLFCGRDPSLSFNFLTKPALNCPSFRKQSGVKWFALPGINEFSESEVKWHVAKYVTHTLNLCSAFNPSKCTHTAVRSEHTHTHTHTHREHIPGAVGSHIAAAPGEQLGVWCLAQGSHLSRGIEGGESAGYSLQHQNGLIIETV